MKPTPLLLVAAIALLLGAVPARAASEVDAEREQLARIDYELERLQVMIAEAGKRAPSGQRVRFRYDWLQRDLGLVRQGIDDHLEAPRQPRAVLPLRGDYRQ